MVDPGLVGCTEGGGSDRRPVSVRVGGGAAGCGQPEGEEEETLLGSEEISSDEAEVNSIPVNAAL